MTGAEWSLNLQMVLFVTHFPIHAGSLGILQKYRPTSFFPKISVKTSTLTPGVSQKEDVNNRRLFLMHI